MQKIIEGLAKGKTYIFPTDTVYALVASLDAPRAINDIYKIKGIPESQHLRLLCRDVAMASHYAIDIDSSVFRFMKSATPGPYTFIFKANRRMDRRGIGKKKSVGVRIVNHPLIQMLLEEAEYPLISSSITVEDEMSSDPEALEALYGHRVEAIVDGGILAHEYSTVIDCSGRDVLLIRQGIGPVEGLSYIEELDHSNDG